MPEPLSDPISVEAPTQVEPTPAAKGSPSVGPVISVDGTDVWPASEGLRIVFLMDAASSLERRVLEDWVRRRKPEAVEQGDFDLVTIPASRGRRRLRRNLAGLDDIVAAGEEAIMQPLRVAWMAPPGEGVGVLRLQDVLLVSDPRDPGVLRQHWTLRRHPERLRVVIGEPATLGQLRERWRARGGNDDGETTGLSEFVARQAGLALERAERRLRGARYKVPKFVGEAILSRPAVRGGLARLARQQGRPGQKVTAEAASYLKEIAATHSPFVIDLVAQAIRKLYSRGYGESLHYDKRRLEEIYALAQRHPVVFLPSHKSNLDHLVLQYALHENGHPPNHTAGGINMNFFPVGPLVRRSGVFFIRRTFKDNEVYKFVLRSYIDYLIEKRFSLEWYIEGGRSRSGKLLPPRFGLLSYVVDSFLRGRSEDVILVPVSIAYDQIQDVGDYVAEQSGAAKKTESFGWLLQVIRKLGRRYGDIHLRFGDPVSLREVAKAEHAASGDADEPGLELRKLAFDVGVRINRVTPITPTSLVTLAMLGMSDRAVSLQQIVDALRNLTNYIKRRELPVTEALDVEDPTRILGVLEDLVSTGVLQCYAEGAQPVWMIRDNEHLSAAYYRNTIIHFFVTGSICELATLAAAEAPDGSDRLAIFWDEAMALRDLLKFEFFFSTKAAFRARVDQDMSIHEPDWQAMLADTAETANAVVRSIRPYNAHRVLRPFLDAYQVIGDVLAGAPVDADLDPASVVTDAMALGKQYRLQRRIERTESVSKVLFQTALKLAANRKLLAAGDEGLTKNRQAFAEELRSAVRRCEAIDALARSRRAGLIQ
ncbi:MAG: glycerol-3-phosphate O-acyltransferase [Hyphomicrobiaceae bacterium]